MDQNTLDFYRTSSAMSDAGLVKAGSLAASPSLLPQDVAGLARVVQGVLLHEHLASTYGEVLTDERRTGSHLRNVASILDAITAIDGHALDYPRPPAKRLVGVCRHFTLLMVTLMRAKGYAARSRCGFGTYFEAGKFVDHWVAEYWHEGEHRWVMVDAQLDDILATKFNIDFDPLDVPRDRFVVAGDGWAQVREDRTDAKNFGIMHMWGSWFIAGNLVRDVASLNKVEMLPWDVWGMMPPVDAPVPVADMAKFDHMAALTRTPDTPLDKIKALYADVAVPRDVFNAVLNRPETV